MIATHREVREIVKKVIGPAHYRNKDVNGSRFGWKMKINPSDRIALWTLLRNFDNVTMHQTIQYFRVYRYRYPVKRRGDN